MRAFEYASPTTPEQALKLLTPGSAPLAGGSDLLALMKDEVETPGRLVNLKDLRDLRGIRWDPKTGLRIGALVTIDEVASDPTLKFDYSALAESFARVAGPQIRNVATVGGNLCQRPRCWYFRNGFGLLPMKDGKSMAVEGDNRFHAILGNDGPACFVTPSTVAPLLVALGTQIAVLGPQGERRMDLESFFRIPQKEGRAGARPGAGRNRHRDLGASRIGGIPACGWRTTKVPPPVNSRLGPFPRTPSVLAIEWEPSVPGPRGARLGAPVPG